MGCQRGTKDSRLAKETWTYVAEIQNRRILLLDLGKDIALVAQQPVHVPDKTKILLVL